MQKLPITRDRKKNAYQWIIEGGLISICDDAVDGIFTRQSLCGRSPLFYWSLELPCKLFEIYETIRVYR